MSHLHLVESGPDPHTFGHELGGAAQPIMPQIEGVELPLETGNEVPAAVEEGDVAAKGAMIVVTEAGPAIVPKPDLTGNQLPEDKKPMGSRTGPGAGAAASRARQAAYSEGARRPGQTDRPSSKSD